MAFAKLNSMKFVGLEGLKHFWSKAKSWIANEITTKIAEIVAEAPEDLNTLKEISDWISTHEDSASAMNSNIIKNQSDINELNNKLSSIELLKVGANTITLRDGNPTALGNTELAGVVTKNYDGNNHNNIISIDKNGVARTGDIDIATRILYSNDGTNFFTDESLTIPATIGTDENVRDTGNQTSGGVKIYEGVTYSNNDTQALATREDNPVDGALMKWNAAKKKLVSAGAQLSTIVEASSTTITGPVLGNSGIITVLFTVDLSANDDATGLVITYNENPINVMVSKDGVLSPFTAANIGWGKQSAVYRYLDAYTTLNLYYNGTNLIIIDNPIVLKNESYSATLSQYSIHADGSIDDGKIGDIKPRGICNLPYGWLECDGAAVSRNTYSKLFNFFLNETYDSDSTHTLLSRYGVGDANLTFNLPDLRECVLVGAGQSTMTKIANHDVYGLAEFKDDQIQDHNHEIRRRNNNGWIPSGWYITDSQGRGTSNGGDILNTFACRHGETTHGKQLGVNYIIKVL